MATRCPGARPGRAGPSSWRRAGWGRVGSTTGVNGKTQAILTAGVKHIWEHGYDAPYDLLIAQADIASWVNTTNVTGYVARKDPLISYGLTADAANVDTSYIGVVETVYGSVRVRASARIPTKYWAVYKSYGPMDGRNPLVV